MNINHVKIHPQVTWFMESENRVRILQTQTNSITITTNFETCLWNSIWQGFPLSLWEGIDKGSSDTIQATIDRWLAQDLLIEDGKINNG